jgi:hypothetical protein
MFGMFRYATAASSGGALAPPTVISISRTTWNQGESYGAFTITGTGFATAAPTGAVSLGAGITLGTYTVDSDTQITVNTASVDLTATLGTRDVTVTTPAGSDSLLGGVTVDYTLEAVAFIATHNTATGLSMASLQQNAVNGLFQRVRGAFTTNGNNVKSFIKALPLFAPTNDSTASAAGYALDFLLTNNITWTGFVAGDFTPTGLQGGAGKYGLFGFAPNSLSNDAGLGVYKRSAGVDNTWVIGSSINAGNADGFMIFPQNTATQAWSRLFDTDGGLVTLTDTTNTGYIHAQRTAGNKTFYKNGIANTAARAIAITAKNTFNLMVMGFNRGGTLTNNWTGNSGGFCVTDGTMTAAQIRDLSDAIVWYQQNIITGGRAV